MENNSVIKNEIQEAEESELIDYWHVIYLGKWFILGLTALAILVAAIYQHRRPDLYRADARLMVEKVSESTKLSQKMQMPTLGSDQDSSNDGTDTYETQLSILRSSQVQDMVIKELGGNVPSFEMNAARVRKTSIIGIWVITEHQEWAAPVANKYLEIFIRENSNQQLFINEQLLKYIPDDVDIGRDMRKDLIKSSESNPSYKASTVGLGNSSFNKNLFAESMDAITSDTVIEKLKQEKSDLESKLNELMERYRPEHPDVREVSERLDVVDRKLKERTRVLLNHLKATLAGKMQISNIRVLEEATPPNGPFGPNRSRGIIMAGFAAFIAGCVGVLLFDSFHPKVRAQKDLRNIPLLYLGSIPYANYLRSSRDKQETNSLDSLIKAVEGNVQLADAIVNVRTHILFSISYDKSKKIMITSAVPGEGKTTVSVLLSLSFAALGRKILLIDADMRKPAVAKYLNIKTDFGLSDYLLGISSFEEIIYPIPGHSLTVITAGTTRTTHIPELLGSANFQKLIEDALTSYDRVIVDVPPSLYIPDGLIVAKHMQAGFLVCGANMVYKKTIRTVKEKFDNVGMPLSGLIVNKTDYSHDNYYGKKYSKYYTESTELKPGAARLTRWGFADKPKPTNP